MSETPDAVVAIDPDHLDKECIRLPSDYLRAAHAAAEAKRDVQEGEAELSVIQADLGKAVRSDPEKYGIDKITVDAVNQFVTTHSRYQKHLAVLQEMRYHSELAQAVVWAMEHKKKALTLLVELHGMGYFSAPKISSAGREAVEQMTQRRVRRGRED